MTDILDPKNIGDTIKFVMPGFVAAWVFYGLTPHPKKGQFERTVQAFIFLAFILISLWGVEVALTSVPQKIRIGDWTEQVALFWSIVVAIVVGFSFAVFANKDWPHCWLRKISVTKRHSYPSEWASTFNRDERFVVLHLKNEDSKSECDLRVMGRAVEFPDNPDSGHFVLCDAEWLGENNESTSLTMVYRMLIRVTDVKRVEMLNDADASDECSDEPTISSTTHLAAQLAAKHLPNGGEDGRRKKPAPKRRK